MFKGDFISILVLMKKHFRVKQHILLYNFKVLQNDTNSLINEVLLFFNDMNISLCKY